MTERDLGKKLIAFTAPSGAGKTTIVRHLLESFDFLEFSISATTRKKREGEVDGKHYYFLAEEAFRQKIAAGEFAEYEEVYSGQFYGTLKSEIDRIWNLGKIVVFDIDVKGAAAIKEIYHDSCHTIFIKPPSFQALIDRLKSRKTESEASLKKRVAKARYELSFESRFDSVLVNDLLDVALKEAEIFVKDFLDIVDNGD